MLKIFLGSVLIVMSDASQAAPPSSLKPTKVSTSESFLEKKTAVVEKLLKKSDSFEKRLKVILAFQSWTNKQIFNQGSKMSEDEMTELMQYANLLKALKPQTLTPKNCKSAGNRVVDEDLTPISEDLSPVAKKLLEWLKVICPKTKAS